MKYFFIILIPFLTSCGLAETSTVAATQAELQKQNSQQAVEKYNNIKSNIDAINLQRTEEPQKKLEQND